MKPTIDYESPAWWEFYSDDIMHEYRQSMDEGLDVESLKDVFEAVSKMKRSAHKEAICDTLFNMVCEAKMREDFKYNEPSSLEEIKAERNLSLIKKGECKVSLENKIKGAWYGRICGCLLGKPVECAWTSTIIEILKF